MKRDAFLEELRGKLAERLEPDDLLAALSYYAEMIDDRVEEGFGEEEAVRSLGSTDDIAREVLGDAPRPAAETARESERGGYTRKTFVAEAAQITAVAVRDRDLAVELAPSKDGKVRVCYSESARDKYTVFVDANGLLAVVYESERKWFQYLGWNFAGREKLVVEVPAAFGRDVELTSSNAAIEAHDLHLHTLTAKSSNGGLTARNLQTDETLTLVTSNGAAAARNVRARKLHLHSENAALQLENAQIEGAARLETWNGTLRVKRTAAESLTATDKNGKIALEDVRVAEALSLSTSNGSIQLKNLEAAAIEARTGNASISLEDVRPRGDVLLYTCNDSIKGELRADARLYSVDSKTSNGTNLLPNRTEGQYRLVAHTANANIKLAFV